MGKMTLFCSFIKFVTTQFILYKFYIFSSLFICGEFVFVHDGNFYKTEAMIISSIKCIT